MSRFRVSLPRRPFRRSVLFLAGLIACAWSATGAAQSVWELTPYRVQLIVGFDPSAQTSPRLRADLRQGLLDRIETVIGVSWEVTPARPTPTLRHRLTNAPEQLTLEDLPEDSLGFDKVMLVGVTTGPTGQEIVARELDVRTRLFGAVVRLPAWQPAKLRDTAFRAMLDAFAPLALVVKSEKKTVTLRLRAAGLPIRDKRLLQVRPGDLFQPLIRYNDRQGKLRKVVPVAWTFFVVEEYTPKTFQCAIHSALRNPMSMRRRGRVEQLALAVRGSGSSSRLILEARDEPKHALAGYDVYSRPSGSKSTTLLGRTDAAGAIRVPATNDPLRVLLIKNGGVLLARLPIVPGLVPELTAEIPDDDPRLEAEGFITGLRENLVDLVTRRQRFCLCVPENISRRANSTKRPSWSTNCGVCRPEPSSSAISTGDRRNSTRTISEVERRSTSSSPTSGRFWRGFSIPRRSKKSRAIWSTPDPASQSPPKRPPRKQNEVDLPVWLQPPPPSREG